MTEEFPSQRVAGGLVKMISSPLLGDFRSRQLLVLWMQEVKYSKHLWSLPYGSAWGRSKHSTRFGGVVTMTERSTFGLLE